MDIRPHLQQIQIIMRNFDRKKGSKVMRTELEARLKQQNWLQGQHVTKSSLNYYFPGSWKETFESQDT